MAIDEDAGDEIQGFTFEHEHRIRNLRTGELLWRLPIGGNVLETAHEMTCEVLRLQLQRTLIIALKNLGALS